MSCPNVSWPHFSGSEATQLESTNYIYFFSKKLEINIIILSVHYIRNCKQRADKVTRVVGGVGSADLRSKIMNEKGLFGDTNQYARDLRLR